MPVIAIHTVQRSGSWANEICGVQVGSLHDAKEAAVSAAGVAAAHCKLDHQIHGADGLVVETRPYRAADAR
ncbi:MAG: DUF2188 domain-containing protein [Cellulomonas sp.]